METEKINAIRHYLERNGVKYYDVQAELIDHFSTAVEKEEREHPSTHFRDALLKAHRSFGGQEGFRKYIEAAEVNVRKKVLYLTGQTLLRFLKWPYLLVALATALTWYLTFPLWELYSERIFTGIALAFLLVTGWNALRLRKVKMFLPRRASSTLGWVFYFILYIPGSGSFLFADENPGRIFCTIYFTLLCLILAAFVKMPALTIRETGKLYPQIA